MDKDSGPQQPGTNDYQVIPAATTELIRTLSGLEPTESQPIPREVQKALLESYTVKQLVTLATRSMEVKFLGFGTLKVIFKKSIAKLIETSRSDEI